jgi:HEAT repeat protein
MGKKVSISGKRIMRSAKLAVWTIVVFSLAATAQQVTPPTTQKEIEKRRSSQEVNGKNLFDWMGELKSTDPSIKMKAVATLKAYGTAAQEATPQLLKALTDKDASTRVNACITLGMIGFNERDKRDGIAHIITLLNDVQGIVRYQAAVALSNFGADASAAVPRLVTLTKDTITWEIRSAACTALATTGLRIGAGIDPQAWLALLDALRDSCFEVRYAALQGLLYMGKPLTPADLARENAALQNLFNERHEVLAIWSRLCYMRINGVAEVHLTGIARHLRSARPEARAEACKAFAIIGVEAKSKVSDIMNHLDDKDAVTAIWACAAVAQMKDAGMIALPRLRILAQGNDVDDGVKQAALQAIARLGGDDAKPGMAAKDVAPKKGANAGKQPDEKRKNAHEFNGKTFADWMADLRNTDPSIKLKAIASIKVYGEKAREATPLLLRSLGERDASARVNACITLGAIGFDDKDKAEAIARIIPLLDDKQGIVRFQAATALSNYGPDAASAIPRLVTLSKDPMTWEIREVACTALATSGLQAGKGIDSRAWVALLEVIHDPCFEVKYAALKGLLYLGRPTTPADISKESLALQSIFADKQERIGIWSRLCYMRINGVSEVHLSAIAKFLRSARPESRAEACKAFAIIGPEAKGQVGDLMGCLDDKDSVTLLWACAAIAQMKEAGKVAIPKLKELSTSHSDPGVRGAAAEATRRLGDDQKVRKD